MPDAPDVAAGLVAGVVAADGTVAEGEAAKRAAAALLVPRTLPTLPGELAPAECDDIPELP